MDSSDTIARYARQTVLGEIGEDGQARLSGSTVLVVGAGGLGSPVLQYLAGAGVGHIRIVDPDNVELHNLHRQPLFVEGDVGKPKARAAAHRLACLNRGIQFEPINRPLNPGNVQSMLAGAAVALDCADNFAVSYTMSDACRNQDVPLISASALGLSGYVGAFCHRSPSLRAVFPELPPHAANCASAGVLGPVVGLLGSCQAQMCLSLLLKLEPSPLGRMLRFDGRLFRMTEVDFRGAPEPPGRLFTFMSLAEVGPADLVADLRSREEAPIAAVAHAVRLDAETCGESLPHPGTGERAVFCCRTGVRAWKAARQLRRSWEGEIRLVATANEEIG